MTQGDMTQVCAIINKEIKRKELFPVSQNRRTRGQQMVQVTCSKQSQGHFPTSS